jgi:glycosyltransferase involved in cell wall biosynthesis
MTEHSPVIHRNSRPFSAPRVAIVHYWLVAMRGGERVVERLLRLYPGADLFTHVYDPAAMSATIREARVTTSFINRLPFAKKAYQCYLPLMPMALEELDLTGYDVVISSESGPAKGVMTAPGSLHLCYCHSPMRYIWDHYHQYRNSTNPLARLAMSMTYHKLRQWDVTSAQRVDRHVANSHFVAQRIRKFWRREADVIHPPVDIDLFTPSRDVGNGYIWVGQLVPYKRPDLAVEAFNRNGLPLTIIGRGKMSSELRRMARPNIRFIERLGFNELRQAYAECRAMVMTAQEDFGIAPVEAMASGRPVIAYGSGGALDTVVPGSTGLLFHRQDAESLIDAVDEMETLFGQFDPNATMRHARQFSSENFDRKIAALIASAL